MKKKLQSILFILILTLLIQVSVNAQKTSQKNTEAMLIGTWVLDFKKSTDSITFKSKRMYSQLNKQTQDNIKTLYLKRKLSFLSNGQLILELAPNVQRKGSWKLLADKKSLYIKMDSGRELNQTIEKISTNYLRLNLGGDQSEDDNRLFHKWHLTKINQ